MYELENSFCCPTSLRDLSPSPTFHFWKFSLFLPFTADLRVGGVDLPPPPTKIGLSFMLSRINPIVVGLFWRFFVFTHAFEDMRWIHATCSLHKHFRRCSYIYDEIVGFRWGCGEWGGLFPTVHFWKFSIFLPITAVFGRKCENFQK